jgi:hypothetical protein
LKIPKITISATTVNETSIQFPVAFFLVICLAVALLVTIAVLVSFRKTRVVGLVLLCLLVMAAGALTSVRFLHERGPIHETASRIAAPVDANVPDDAIAPAAETLPAWCHEPAKSLADGTYVTRVQIDDVTPERCLGQLDQALAGAVETYARDALFGEPHAVRVPIDFVRANILKDQHMHEPEFSAVGRVTLYARLEFNPQVQQALRSMRQEQLVTRRVAYMAAAVGLALVALATVFGYLKLDTLTKGYYTGRLRLAAIALVLVVLVLAEMLRRGLIVESFLTG